MTSTGPSLGRGSSASSSALHDSHHESKFAVFRADFTTDLKKLKGAFSHHTETRKAPLPPDTTPTDKIDAPHKENFIMRGIHDVEGRIGDIRDEFRSKETGEAITDTLLLPTHMMMDQVYKPVAKGALHVVAEAGPAILKETAGPLAIGGVVVIAIAMLIFLSYREVNHVVDKALG